MKTILKKCYYCLLGSLLLLLNACGVIPTLPFDEDPQIISVVSDESNDAPPPPSICLVLDAEILEISPKDENNEISVSYQIKNNIDKDLESVYNECKLLFLVKTKQGTQIAHSANIYSELTAESVVLKTENIFIATYEVEEIELKLLEK